LNSLPVLGWILACVWRRRREALANNPRLRRRRQVAQIVNDGVEELRQLAAQNQPKHFSRGSSICCRSKRRALEPAGLIHYRGRLDERLKPPRLPTRLRRPDECFNRAIWSYAPVHSSRPCSFYPRNWKRDLQLRRFDMNLG
jgi:hypothetical protein